MNKKQFLLLSLLACTVASQSDMQASTSRLRTVAANSLTLLGLLGGGYAGTIAIIGYNNANLPALDKEAQAKLSEEKRKHLEYLRQNPYTGAFEELNGMIVDDYTRLSKTVSDKAALEKAAKDAYAALTTAAGKAFNKVTGVASDKPAISSNDDVDAEDNK